MVPDIDSSPFVSSQQTTEGELYAGNAQSSSYLTGEPVAYLLGLVVGIFQLGLGCLLFTQAVPHLSAAEIGLLSLLKTTLGPLWV
jgi:hypothetical protein